MCGVCPFLTYGCPAGGRGRGRGENGDERGHEGGHLFGGRVALDDAQFGHSGMFPCFLGGSVARLSRSARSALTIWTLVSDGLITAST